MCELLQHGGGGAQFRPLVLVEALDQRGQERVPLAAALLELTVSKTLRERGQIRDVSMEALGDLKALEQRAEDRLERKAVGPDNSKQSEEASK